MILKEQSQKDLEIKAGLGYVEGTISQQFLIQCWLVRPTALERGQVKVMSREGATLCLVTGVTKQEEFRC